MRDIEIRKRHQIGIEDAKKCLKVIELELDRRFGAVLRWEGDEAAVIGRGVKGAVRVSEVDVTVNLRISLFFFPLIGLIREEIKTALDREFPA